MSPLATCLGPGHTKQQPLELISKKNTVEEQKSAALKDIESVNADVEIYTDGSAAECRDGGSKGTINIRETNEDFEVTAAAGKYTSSYIHITT